LAANVEPEEAEALREALDASAESRSGAVQRDFSRPVRLSAHDVEALQRRFAAVLEEVEARFSNVLGVKVPIRLSSLREISAADLFAEDESPYAALRFEVRGQPGWVLWDPIPAVSAVEKVLGSRMEVPRARRLSSIECTVLNGFLGAVADVTLRSLEVEADNAVVALSREALGSWLDAGDSADPHRLHVSLRVEGPGGASRIDAYLPLGAALEAAAAEVPQELPAHLDEVDVEVSVRIRGSAVRLEQLLGLEVGDVIPLDGQVGDPALFLVEGEPFATGLLGTRRGNLAIRIEELDHETEDSR